MKRFHRGAGAGLIGRRHIELIRQRGDCELAAIVDPAPAAAAFARDAGVTVHKTLADLFASERPHGVIAATPNSMHVRNGVDCVAHGVPVLIEKPVADSVQDARRLIDAAERAGSCSSVIIGATAPS